MKYSVHSRTDVKRIPKETTDIHASRPLRLRMLKRLLHKCPALKTISLSKSAFERLSRPVKLLLQKHKMQLMIVKAKGRPIAIELEKMLHIIELRRDYRSYGEIAEITGVPKSTVHYLIKYAQRTKVRHNNQTVHLAQ